MRVPAAAVSITLAAILATSVSLTAAPTASGLKTTTLVGADISWPNCPKGEGIPSRRSEGEPMPDRTARFVIVGLTNGPGFYPNPCLASQLSWVSSHHRLLGAYALTTYPRPKQVAAYRDNGPYDATTSRGALRNAAYAEATYNLSTMRSEHITVPMIWVDVEPYPVSPWSKSHRNNRAVVSAVIRAYTNAGYRVGIYTFRSGWRQTVGAWRLPKLPTWSTIGAGRQARANRTCGRGPSGGPDWLMQWWVGTRDKDVVCPAGRGQTAEMFAV